MKQSGIRPSGRLSKIIMTQIAAILGLSLALGLSFNASNPIGVRWAEPSISAATTPLESSNSPTSVTSKRPANLTTVASVSSLKTPAPGSPQIPASTVANSPSTDVTQTNQVAQPTSWALAKPRVAAKQVVLVDARPKAAFDAGHIPTAVSLPEASTVEEFAAFQKQYNTNQHLIVYCSSTSCSVSKRVADKLMKDYGYQNVEFMTGGYQEWQQAEQGTAKSN